MIYASTQCLPNRSLAGTLDSYAEHGIERVELGFCPDATVDVAALVDRHAFEFVAHNYFLPRDDEFILNLASPDDALRERTIEYLKDAITFCDRYSIPRYTFHGGFRVDPDTSLTFPKRTPPPYEECFERFVTALRPVLDHAEAVGVDIAVENNVVTTDNVVGSEPLLLFCQPGEFTRLFDRIDPSRCDVLLDVGHLTVSATTFDYDRKTVFKEADGHLGGLHLHSNDGRTDEHRPLAKTDRAALSSLSLDGVPLVVESHHRSAIDLKQYIQRLG